MNYSVELWDNYNKVQKTLHFHLQGLKEIIKLYTDQYNYQLNYASLLKTSNKSNKQITVFESLYHGFSLFKEEMLNQYKYLSEFLNGIKNEIIKPLSALYDTSLKRLNFNVYEMNSIEQSYQASVQSLENAKKNFHTFAKDAEQSKIKSESYKEKNDSSLTNLIKKEETKMLNSLKNAKENEKKYIELIDQTNNLQGDYIEIKKRNLIEVQDIEQEVAENIKDSFRKFITFQIAYIRNMEYDIKKKSSIFEGININKDINKFINNNKTGITMLYKYKYIPYISQFEKINENDKKIYSENIINNVKLFMSHIFSKERPNEINPSSEYNKNEIITEEIKEVSTKIFNKEILSNKIKENINKLFLMKKTRRQLLIEINNNDLSKLNESNFDNISYLLKEVLKVLQIEKDYESVNLILNFINNFCQIGEDKEKRRIFIQNNLIDQKIFASYEFWKELIKYNIIEEMFNQKNYNSSSKKKEDEDKINLKIKEIVLSKINIYLNYMIDFKCKYNFMKQLIEEFKDYYELNDNDIEKFISKINEYNKIIGKRDRNEIENDEALNEDNAKNLNINDINNKEENK